MLSIRDALRQMWRDVRSQKLRTFLTVFGIVWGTVSVSLLLAFGKGLQRQMIVNSSGIGDAICIACPQHRAIVREELCMFVVPSSVLARVTFVLVLATSLGVDPRLARGGGA